MAKGSRIVRRLALVLAVIAALVGWAAALVADSHVTDLEEIAIVPSGTRLRVYETVEGGTWHKVGSVGFMYHELLKPVAG